MSSENSAATAPSDESPSTTESETAPSGWRYWLGLILLVLSLTLPLIALVLVPLLGFPEGVNVVLFGLSLAGGPDLLLVPRFPRMGKNAPRRLVNFMVWL